MSRNAKSKTITMPPVVKENLDRLALEHAQKIDGTFKANASLLITDLLVAYQIASNSQAEQLISALPAADLDRIKSMVSKVTQTFADYAATTNDKQVSMKL